MTIGILDTNQTLVIEATIPTVQSPILVVRWLSEHYYNSRPINDGSTMVEDTNLPPVTKATIFVVWALGAFVEATILTIHPPVGHYSAVRWVARPIRRCLLKPLFQRFGHKTSTTSSSIGRATGVGCLLKI